MVLFVEIEWEIFASHTLVLLLKYIPTMECAQLITFKSELVLNSWLVQTKIVLFIIFLHNAWDIQKNV